MKKILIVEDDSNIHPLLTRMLSGFTERCVKLLFAEGWQEGLWMTRQERPDLIFLDILMPRMGGFKVCEEVKKDPILQDIYIILFTSLRGGFDKELGRQVMANDYITNPSDIYEIVKKTSDVLRIEIGAHNNVPIFQDPNQRFYKDSADFKKY